MKKIMIAAAIVCAAAFAQAATCSWASGTFKQAANAQGGWGSAGVSGSSGVLVTMQVILVDAETYSTVMAKTQAGIYDWAKTASGEGITKLDPKQNLNSTGTSKTGTITIEKDLTPNTDYKSIVIASYEDSSWGTMVMAKGVEFNSLANGKANTNIFGGTGGMQSWTAVANIPEPTSAMLLLLGVAGMALRRRRA